MNSATLMLPSEALAQRRMDVVDAAASEVQPQRSPQTSAVQAREGFRVGMTGLMVGYADGSELADLPAIHRLPNAPAWFRGMVNLHGLLIPAFDLASRLGVESAPGAKPMLLVLGHGPDAAGFIIDGLPVRLRFEAADEVVDAPVPAPLQGCVRGTYWIDGHAWLDLDAGALLQSLTAELAQH